MCRQGGTNTTSEETAVCWLVSPFSAVGDKTAICHVCGISMIISPRHFVRFVDGRAGKRLIVAYLPGALASQLGTSQSDVTLTIEYARKLVHKHKIAYTKFDEIQNTIDHGYCLKEDDRHIYFLYMPDLSFSDIIYVLVIKTDAANSGLWLKTFHRITKKQFDKRLQKGRIIRNHTEEFME